MLENWRYNRALESISKYPNIDSRDVFLDQEYRTERHKVALVDEGARSLKQEFGDLRNSDPFAYSMLAGIITFTHYIDTLRNTNTGMRMVTSDRGQIDRRGFRKVSFGRGEVNPEIMAMVT